MSWACLIILGAMEVISGFGMRSDVKKVEKGDRHRGRRDAVMSHDWPVAMSHDWPVAPLTDTIKTTDKSIALQ